MGASDQQMLLWFQNEYGFAISTLLYLQARKGHSASGCANLVSCGGNGWVRFWNTASTALVGEYIAHSQGQSAYVYFINWRIVYIHLKIIYAYFAVPYVCGFKFLIRNKPKLENTCETMKLKENPSFRFICNINIMN